MQLQKVQKNLLQSRGKLSQKLQRDLGIVVNSNPDPLGLALQKKLRQYQNNEERKTANQDKFKFSFMMCCAAPSSGGVSIDMTSKPMAEISREPSFSILDQDEGNLLQLVMQPSRNIAKPSNVDPDLLNPLKFLEAQPDPNPNSEDTKFSLFES